MTATAPAAHSFDITTDAWTLRAMRDAKVFRDANPDPEHAAADAYLDAWLAACEDAVAEVGTTADRPVADEPTSAPRGNGWTSTGRTGTPATDAQLRYIASLSRDLGYALQEPRDKAHASLIIDGAKKALDKARREGKAPAAAARPATEAQIAYLRALVTERETDVDPARVDEITAETTSFDLARQLITAFQARPRRAAAVAAHGIREGRYAFQPDGAQAMFLRVSRTGRVYSQAGPSEHPYRGQDTEALRWIAANPREAAALYGQLLGRCGRCGRDLTDETSRARGLGPDCAGKTDW